MELEAEQRNWSVVFDGDVLVQLEWHLVANNKIITAKQLQNSSVLECNGQHAKHSKNILNEIENVTNHLMSVFFHQ